MNNCQGEARGKTGTLSPLRQTSSIDCIAPASFTHSHPAPAPGGVAAEVLEPLCSSMAFRARRRLRSRKTILENPCDSCPFLSANFDYPYRGASAPIIRVGGDMEFPKVNFRSEKACFE